MKISKLTLKANNISLDSNSAKVDRANGKIGPFILNNDDKQVPELTKYTVTVNNAVLGKENYDLVKDGNNILGKYSDMVEISKKYSVDKVIVVEEGIFEQELLSKLLSVKLEGIRVYNFLDFYEKIEEKIPVKTINENWFL